MALTGLSNTGTSNNTTAVTLVAAPTANVERDVRCVNVYNNDTVSATVTIRLNDNSSTRILYKTTLAAGDTLVLGAEDLYVLNTTTKSLELVLAGAITTNQLDWVATYADIS
jgi:hypothetical protein